MPLTISNTLSYVKFLVFVKLPHFQSRCSVPTLTLISETLAIGNSHDCMLVIYLFPSHTYRSQYDHLLSTINFRYIPCGYSASIG